jgi:DNA-binding transcriptional MerR regulator/effector-binding domain-containing protein
MDTDRPKVTGEAPGAQRLMPIGIFSRMTGLSHRALRLYADRGLLSPAHVDETTGYRYYDVHSIRAAEMIRLLRRLGVPLGEMRLYIDAAATDRLEETLTQQKERLEQEQARLDAALRLLGRIDELDGMFRAAPAVELVELPTERCLRWAGTMARSEFHESYVELATVLAGRAAESGLTPAGREYVVLLDPTDKGLAGGDETVLRYELCLPVAGETSSDPAADLVELEGGRFARSVFSGLYEDGYRFAYARQLEWLADSGRGLRGRLRMRFTRDERDTADPADFATELLWPVTEPLPEAAEERPPDLTHGWLRP